MAEDGLTDYRGGDAKALRQLEFTGNDAAADNASVLALCCTFPWRAVFRDGEPATGLSIFTGEKQSN